MTMDSYATTTAEAVADIEALHALGATPVLIPVAMFGSDPVPSLCRYGQEVIGQI
jgi:hypothetical protein